MSVAIVGDPARHPLSREFEWRDAPPASQRRLTQAQSSAFNSQGFTKLDQVFTPEEVAAVTAAIDPIEAEYEALVRAEHGGHLRLTDVEAITFTTHLVAKSPALRAFAAHPAIKDICADLIGPDVRLYWDQSVYKKTGKSQEFPWHQDNGYTFIEPQQYLTLWIPLVDVDEENGCPWIAPGMHRLGTLQHWRTDIGLKCLESAPDAVAAPARAGDVVAFSSLAPHRTGPNLKTGSVRKAYILQYAPDGARALSADGEFAMQDDPARQFKILSNGA